MTEQVQADPGKIIEVFKERVLLLAKHIREWTNADPDLSVEIAERDIEDMLGRYSVAQIRIFRLGVCIARFVPLSASVIGARGRIDVDGPLDRAVILYIESEVFVVTHIAPRGREVQARETPVFRGVREPGWYWISDARAREVRFVDATAFRSLIAMVAGYEIA